MKYNDVYLPAQVDKQAFSVVKLFSFPSHPPKLNAIHFPNLASYHHLGISARQNPFDIGNLQISLRDSKRKFTLSKCHSAQLIIFINILKWVWKGNENNKKNTTESLWESLIFDCVLSLLSIGKYYRWWI